MSTIEQLTKDGQNIYPVTTPDAIRDEQGRSIKDLITERDITDMNALASMVVATPTQQSFIERATPAGGIAYIPKVYGNSIVEDGVIKNLTATGIESRSAAGAVVASLPLNISGIVRGDGTQLFPNGLLSAGSVRDMVDRANGRAERRILAKVFDGTEEWAGYAQDPAIYGSHGWIFDLTIQDCKVGINNVTLGDFTTNGEYKGSKTFGIHYMRAETIQYAYGKQGIQLCTEEYSSLNEWTSHLAELYAAGNPLVVYYEAAEPETVTFSPMKAFYKTEQGGTERLTGEDSAPIVADMGYKA